jgi:hypothetical protein
MYHIKIGKLDKLFSQYIRTRDGWKCQVCFTQYEPPAMGLHCAHIFTRGNKSTRYDSENAVAMCYGHHARMDANPLDKYEWYVKRFGQKQFDALKIRTKIPQKIDEKMIEIGLKKELERLQPFVIGGKKKMNVQLQSKKKNKKK